MPTNARVASVWTSYRTAWAQYQSEQFEAAYELGKSPATEA